ALAPAHILALLFLFCFFVRRDSPSFPTRRSSDLRNDPHLPRHSCTALRAPSNPGLTARRASACPRAAQRRPCRRARAAARGTARSEEHTSELQSLRHLVCRLLLEKKKEKKQTNKF